jgi:hypothetical protein
MVLCYDSWENEGVSTEEFEAHPLLSLNAPKQPGFKNAASGTLLPQRRWFDTSPTQ